MASAILMNFKINSCIVVFSIFLESMFRIMSYEEAE